MFAKYQNVAACTCARKVVNYSSTSRLSNMDYLKDVSKNISLYEVKAYVRKAQNGMFDLVE